MTTTTTSKETTMTTTTTSALEITHRHLEPEGGVPLDVTHASHRAAGLTLDGFIPEGQPQHATVWAHPKGPVRVEVIPATRTSPETLCLSWQGPDNVTGHVYASGVGNDDLLRALMPTAAARIANAETLVDLLAEALERHADETDLADDTEAQFALARWREARR